MRQPAFPPSLVVQVKTLACEPVTAVARVERNPEQADRTAPACGLLQRRSDLLVTRQDFSEILKLEDPKFRCNRIIEGPRSGAEETIHSQRGQPATKKMLTSNESTLTIQYGA